MATFDIIASQRVDLATSTFLVRPRQGSVSALDLVSLEEAGSLWEFVILSVSLEPDRTARLSCAGWIPDTGAFVGLTGQTRRMNIADQRRWAKALPTHFDPPSKGPG